MIVRIVAPGGSVHYAVDSFDDVVWCVDGCWVVRGGAVARAASPVARVAGVVATVSARPPAWAPGAINIVEARLGGGRLDGLLRGAAIELARRAARLLALSTPLPVMVAGGRTGYMVFVGSELDYTVELEGPVAVTGYTAVYRVARVVEHGGGAEADAEPGHTMLAWGRAGRVEVVCALELDREVEAVRLTLVEEQAPVYMINAGSPVTVRPLGEHCPGRPVELGPGTYLLAPEEF